jgi:hypothetical protein
MPAGNVVNYVWRKTGSTQSSNDTVSGAVPASGQKRLCVRYYAKFSQDFHSYDTAPNCTREKIQELQVRPTSGAQFQSEVQGNPDSFHIFWSIGENLTRSGADYGPNNCVNNWCRLEMCFGAVTGDIPGGGTGLPEAWVQPIDGSSPENHYYLASGTPQAFRGPTADTYGAWIINAYNQDNCSANVRYISYAMAASWGTNNGQRIGAAPEVEGAGTPVVNVSPTVSISVASTSFVVGGSTTFTASASDSDGTVSSVSFYVNGVLQTTDTTSPYSTTWSPLSAGSYTITAIATDNQGATGSSNSVSVTVTAAVVPLTVTLAASPATFTQGQSTTLTASVTGTPNSSGISFYNGSTLLSSDTSSPYTYTWTPGSAGSYTLTARGTDSLGNQSTSNQVGVTVDPLSTPATFSCSNVPAGAIWCDDFDDSLTLNQKYADVNTFSGLMSVASGEGTGGSKALRMHWNTGTVASGVIQRTFGRNPWTSQSDQATDFNEIYWKLDVRYPSGWPDGGDKLMRAFVLASPAWAQGAMGHIWFGSSGTGRQLLLMDPASGISTSGQLVSTTYNDFANLRWLGSKQGTTNIFSGANIGACLVQISQQRQQAGQSLLRISAQRNGQRSQRAGQRE